MDVKEIDEIVGCDLITIYVVEKMMLNSPAELHTRVSCKTKMIRLGDCLG
jgi:hypothetical protein